MKQPRERLLSLMVIDREKVRREKVIGAITQLDGKWIFFKRIVPRRDVLRIRGVWGIDSRVMDILFEEGIAEVHCYDEETDTLFVASVEDFRAEAEVLGPHVIKSLITTQSYLALDRWRQEKKTYRTKFISERQRLD